MVASTRGPLSAAGITATAMSTSISAERLVCDRPDWRGDAACRDADPELFFPDGDARSVRAQVKTAKLMCRGCPVSAACLSWALASGQEAGIWGGLTEDERHRLHRRGRRLPVTWHTHPGSLGKTSLYTERTWRVPVR